MRKRAAAAALGWNIRVIDGFLLFLFQNHCYEDLAGQPGSGGGGEAEGEGAVFLSFAFDEEPDVAAFAIGQGDDDGRLVAFVILFVGRLDLDGDSAHFRIVIFECEGDRFHQLAHACRELALDVFRQNTRTSPFLIASSIRAFRAVVSAVSAAAFNAAVLVVER